MGVSLPRKGGDTRSTWMRAGGARCPHDKTNYEKIKSICGRYTIIVDDEDFPLLSRHRWFIHKNELTPHFSYKSLNIPIYRIILAPYRRKEVDHINRNRLDNRKANLRLVTRTQNEMNKAPTKLNTSGYKGVRMAKTKGKWFAFIHFQNKRLYLGTFPSKIEAAKAYNREAIKLYSGYAWLNPV